MNPAALFLSRPLIFGIAVFAAAAVCFLLLVVAAFIVGYLEVGEEETIAMEEELRKAGM